MISGRVVRAAVAVGVVAGLIFGYIKPSGVVDLGLYLLFAVLMFDHNLISELTDEAVQLIKAWRSK